MFLNLLLTSLILTLPAVTSDKVPSFAADSQTEFRVVKGENVTLPCRINDMIERREQPGFVWFHKDKAVYLGEFPIDTKAGRLSLLVNRDTEPKEYNLHIADVQESDIGSYKCRINKDPKQDLNMELDLQMPASVQLVSRKQMELNEGDSVTLECQADGNPLPDVVWTRLNAPLPSGEHESAGEKLLLSDVGRDASGTYQCTAWNTMGNPVSQTLELSVMFPPHVTSPLTTHHTATGETLTLTCHLEALPHVTPHWYKNEYVQIIDGSDQGNFKITDTRSKYKVDSVLTIDTVVPETIANYSCVGVNRLGEGRVDIVVTGLPHPVEILSEPRAYRHDQYKLKWKVVSKTQILGYEIRVGYKNGSMDSVSEWSRPIVISEGERPGGAGEYVGEYTLQDLAPETHYSVRVVARNLYGTTHNTQLLNFTTPKEGVVIAKDDASSATSLTSSLVLIMNVVLLFISTAATYS